MKSSPTITLFADPPPPSRRGPSGIMLSLLVHAAAIGIIFVALRHAVTVDQRSQIYTVRLLNLERPVPHLRWSTVKENTSQTGKPATARAAASMGGWPKPPSVAIKLPTPTSVAQILIQPEAPPNVLLEKEAPLPLVVMWAPESNPVKKIVPPPPQEATIAKVQPSLETPNQAVNLADLKISPSAFATKLPVLPTSTTSPVTVVGPKAVSQVPETASKPLGPPTPTQVVSLSDLVLPTGTVALPLANSLPATTTSGSLAPGHPESKAQEPGTGKASGPGNGESPGKTAGNQNAGEAIGQNGGGAGPGGPGSGNTGSGGDTTGGSGPDGESAPAVTRLTLPKDGQFGVVVVGSTLTEEYPETAGIWSGRLAYSVYLPVGLEKNWILQYSLPRSADANTSGSVVRLIAPWPYYMERPNVIADPDSDTVMIHGFVNNTGRFERLSIVFPQAAVAGAEFLLNTLRHWQFRPAAQNGQATAVEILLIIPSTEEE